MRNIVVDSTLLGQGSHHGRAMTTCRVLWELGEHSLLSEGSAIDAYAQFKDQDVGHPLLLCTMELSHGHSTQSKGIGH